MKKKTDATMKAVAVFVSILILAGVIGILTQEEAKESNAKSSETVMENKEILHKFVDSDAEDILVDFPIYDPCDYDSPREFAAEFAEEFAYEVYGYVDDHSYKQGYDKAYEYWMSRRG